MIGHAPETEAKANDCHRDDEAPDPKAKRLDYIFIGDGARQDDSERPGWQVCQAEVCMTDRHPSLGCSLSDHFAVAATLSLSARTGSPNHIQKGSALNCETYDEILTMISNYLSRETRQQQLRLLHFGFSIAVSIGCLVAVWWSPHSFVSFLLMLVSTVGFGAGLLDGLIGGLFIGSEIRALKEFEWEISTAKTLEKQARLSESQHEGTSK